MSFDELFNNIKAEAGEMEQTFEEKGSVGTGGNKFKIEEDGVYDMVIGKVIFKQSQSTGSAWYDVELKTEGGAKVTTKLFVLNKDGKPYSIEKNGQKKNVYGWNRMASLNFLINKEWDGLPRPELKQVMVYDFESKAEIAKELPIVTSLFEKPITVSIKMVLEDGYPDATVSRSFADVRGFFDPITMKTASEERTGGEAVAIDNFKKSIADNSEPIDKRDKSKGVGETKTSSSSESSSGFAFS